MKKKIQLLFIIISFIMIAILLTTNVTRSISKDLKYSQEYEIGKSNIKGELDISYFFSKNKNFDIGANKYGYAVFKNPNKAFKSLKRDYISGIKLIQKEFHLMPLSKINYKKYKTYGWQVTTGSVDEQEQARFVSSFMDVYENSFKRN